MRSAGVDAIKDNDPNLTPVHSRATKQCDSEVRQVIVHLQYPVVCVQRNFGISSASVANWDDGAWHERCMRARLQALISLTLQFLHGQQALSTQKNSRMSVHNLADS